MLGKRALAAAILAAAPLAVLSGVAAQDATGSAPAQDATAQDATAQDATAQSQDIPAVDFVIRPTESIDNTSPDADIWNWSNEPGPSALETPVGPPLAGPTGDEAIGPPLAGPTPATEPLAKRKIRRKAAVDPFAPVGVNVGSFVIRPSIEIGGTATDNAGGSADKVAAVGAVVAPEVEITSQGDRYQFDAAAGGEIVTYDKSEYDSQTATARATLRYDLSTRTSVETEANYSRFLEGFNDPNTPSAAAKQPAVNEVQASLGVEQRFGRLSAKLTGFVDRAMHEDVPLVGGGTDSREELNNTEFGLRFRTGYATGASLRPFTEVAVGRRVFDNAHDDSGFERSSIWGELRGGLVIDRGDKLSGEASIGYRHEDIEDSRLKDLNVLLANAAIIWSPRRLTEVKLDLSTDVSPTSTPDTSATVLYSSTLTLSHDFTPRITGETGVGLSYEDRIGDNWRDVTFTGFAGASYAFSRTASLEARYTYSRTDRNEIGGKYDSNEVSVRVRLQR